MKARIIVAVILIPILVMIAVYAPIWVFTAAVALVCAIVAYEFMRGAGFSGDYLSTALAIVYAAASPISVYLNVNRYYSTAVFMLFVFAIFFKAVITYKGDSKVISDLSSTLIAAMLIPYLFVSVLRIRMFTYGEFRVLLPFVAAYASDTGAFFIGKAFGKRKLIPYVSPNKTVEGAIGGVVFSILGMVLYGLVLQIAFGFKVEYFRLAFYGLIGSPVAQLGDLAFSLMKREFKIKDYGNLLPGHGGMLDRIDSVVFTSPLIFWLLLWLPAISKV
jgi:phosphatidate cytidylyltransferase